MGSGSEDIGKHPKCVCVGGGGHLWGRENVGLGTGRKEWRSLGEALTVPRLCESHRETELCQPGAAPHTSFPRLLPPCSLGSPRVLEHPRCSSGPPTALRGQSLPSSRVIVNIPLRGLPV